MKIIVENIYGSKLNSGWCPGMKGRKHLSFHLIKLLLYFVIVCFFDLIISISLYKWQDSLDQTLWVYLFSWFFLVGVWGWTSSFLLVVDFPSKLQTIHSIKDSLSGVAFFLKVIHNFWFFKNNYLPQHIIAWHNWQA